MRGQGTVQCVCARASRAESLVCLSHVTGWRRRFQQPLGYKIASWEGISGEGEREREVERGDGELEPTRRTTSVTASHKLRNEAAVVFSLFIFYFFAWNTLTRLINNRGRGRESSGRSFQCGEGDYYSATRICLKGQKKCFVLSFLSTTRLRSGAQHSPRQSTSSTLLRYFPDGGRNNHWANTGKVAPVSKGVSYKKLLSFLFSSFF